MEIVADLPAKYLNPANLILASQRSYVPFLVHSSVIIAILLVDVCYNIITSLLSASLSVQYILMSTD